MVDLAASGARAEGIDCSGVADALAVATAFDGRAVVVGEGFEIVASILRGDVDGVPIGRTVLTSLGGRGDVS